MMADPPDPKDPKTLDYSPPKKPPSAWGIVFLVLSSLVASFVAILCFLAIVFMQSDGEFGGSGRHPGLVALLVACPLLLVGTVILMRKSGIRIPIALAILLISITTFLLICGRCWYR